MKTYVQCETIEEIEPRVQSENGEIQNTEVTDLAACKGILNRGSNKRSKYQKIINTTSAYLSGNKISQIFAYMNIFHKVQYQA